MKKLITLLIIIILTVFLNGCNNYSDKSNKQIFQLNDEKQIIQIDSNKKSDIIFTKSSDSLSSEDFHYANFRNALIKSYITIVNYPNDTTSKVEIYTKCACVRDSNKRIIIFRPSGKSISSDLYLVLNGDSAKAFKYYHTDLNMYPIERLNIEYLYLGAPLTDTSSYIDGELKFIIMKKSKGGLRFGEVSGKFYCGIYDKTKTYYLIPEEIK